MITDGARAAASPSSSTSGVRTTGSTRSSGRRRAPWTPLPFRLRRLGTDGARVDSCTCWAAARPDRRRRGGARRSAQLTALATIEVAPRRALDVTDWHLDLIPRRGHCESPRGARPPAGDALPLQLLALLRADRLDVRFFEYAETDRSREDAGGVREAARRRSAQDVSKVDRLDYHLRPRARGRRPARPLCPASPRAPRNLPAGRVHSAAHLRRRRAGVGGRAIW